jgi:hypothetical protein
MALLSAGLCQALNLDRADIRAAAVKSRTNSQEGLDASVQPENSASGALIPVGSVDKLMAEYGLLLADLGRDKRVSGSRALVT